MAALPPRSSRRRPRRGSLERPVSGRLYRGTWLLVGIPLLVAAFSVHKPGAAAGAAACAAGLLRRPERHGARLGALAGSIRTARPGSAGAAGAAQWFRDQLAPYGLQRRARPLPRRRSGPRRAHARQPGRDRPGPLAGRDRRSWRTATTAASGPGANNNASGIAALIQLARSYGTARRRPPGQPAAHARLRRHRRRRVRRPRARDASPRPTRATIVAAVDARLARRRRARRGSC